VPPRALAYEVYVKNAASIYLRLLDLSRVRSGIMLPELSPEQERLFNHVALAQYRGEALSVRALMALRQLGSPATIHTRLKALRATGWVMLTDPAPDGSRLFRPPQPGATLPGSRGVSSAPSATARVRGINLRG
jgi:hypothetical protein